MPDGRIAGSFRDPSGFLFRRGGTLFRQVNPIYREHYDQFVQGGLSEDLAQRGWLIPHEEVEEQPWSPGAYRVLRPQTIPFVSYPYEWCFSQWKDAGLLTLQIQRKALEHRMSLKDASAFNVQFLDGRAVFVDTLSFERLREGEPWVAYRQFCQHFLAPLALMSQRDARLGQLLRTHLDGVPLDLASSLLPVKTRVRLPLLFHVHLHAGAQKKYSDKAVERGNRSMSRAAQFGLVDSLEKAMRSLDWSPRGTEWAEYYEDTNYSPAGVEHKKKIVQRFLDEVRPASVWDLGANVGLFSRLASERGILTIALDADPAAVEKNYRHSVERGERNLHPLLQDFSNTSAALGWANEERLSLEQRGPADAGLALALVHHLAIGNNVPLLRVADWLARLCKHLLVEFVPKQDSQVQRLLQSREDIFPDYHQAAFEQAFAERFQITDSARIQDSQRILYSMQRRAVP
jgi:hypothetical protein